MKAICNTCQNKGKIRGLSQESYCSGCVHSHSWLADYYEPAPIENLNKEKPTEKTINPFLE